MKTFEEKLARLEEINQIMKRADLSLNESVKLFEEGTKISEAMEKELNQVNHKVQILMNEPALDGSDDPHFKPFTSLE